MEQELFMNRALSLAKLGHGKVKTNPMVGCVIVKNNTIIAEGYHQEFGEAHAEVNALENILHTDLSDCTAFVTLEPCSHFGKTPPCADLLISSGIRKVFVAMLDPNPLVAGRGVKKLQQHGMDVQVGLLAPEAKELNATFVHGIAHQRPFITLKWAESENGFIAGKAGSEKISGPATDIMSHAFRTEVDAICVGSKTILADSPKLDTRLVGEEKKLKVSFGSKLHQGYIPLNPDSIETDLSQLYKNHHVGHLLIEGGARTLQFFMDHKLFNQIRVISSKKIRIEDGTPAPKIDFKTLKLKQQDHTPTDTLTIYTPC